MNVGRWSDHFGVGDLIVFKVLSGRGFGKRSKSHFLPVFYILFWAVHIHHTKPQRLFRIPLTFAVPLCLFFDRREHAVIKFLLGASFFSFFFKHILSWFLVLLSLLGFPVGFVVAVAEFEFEDLVNALFGHLFGGGWGFIWGLA
jgi:hypothetical protein